MKKDLQKNIPAMKILNFKHSLKGTKIIYGTIQFLITVVLSVVLSSCASTGLSHMWQDPTYVSGPLKTILVVAVRKDQKIRRAWEDGFATELRSDGIDVTPSYRLFPDTLPDTNLIKTITKNQRFDGIILVGRASTQTIESVTSRDDINSSEISFQPLDASYYGYYVREYYPGYPVFNDVVKDEIKVWATQGVARMIWTGVGEVQNSDVHEDERRAIIHIIVPELVKHKIIAAGS